MRANGGCRCVGFAVADAKKKTHMSKKLQERVKKSYFWLSLRIIDDFDIAPRCFFAKSTAKSLDYRFFSCKSSSEPCRRILEAQTIRFLFRGEEPIEKSLPVVLKGCPNTINLDNISSNSPDIRGRHHLHRGDDGDGRFLDNLLRSHYRRSFVLMSCV